MFVKLHSTHDGLPFLISIKRIRACVEWPDRTYVYVSDDDQQRYDVKEKVATIEVAIKSGLTDYYPYIKG